MYLRIGQRHPHWRRSRLQQQQQPMQQRRLLLQMERIGEREGEGGFEVVDDRPAICRLYHRNHHHMPQFQPGCQHDGGDNFELKDGIVAARGCGGSGGGGGGGGCHDDNEVVGDERYSQ